MHLKETDGMDEIHLLFLIVVINLVNRELEFSRDIYLFIYFYLLKYKYTGISMLGLKTIKYRKYRDHTQNSKRKLVSYVLQIALMIPPYIISNILIG